MSIIERLPVSLASVLSSYPSKTLFSMSCSEVASQESGHPFTINNLLTNLGGSRAMTASGAFKNLKTLLADESKSPSELQA